MATEGNSVELERINSAMTKLDADDMECSRRGVKRVYAAVYDVFPS